MKLFEFDEHIGDWRVLVQTRDIKNGAITTRCIASGAVTSDKIEDGAITNDKIAENTINGSKFADNSIDNGKVKNGTLSGEKFVDNSIDGEKIKDNTVPGEKLKDNTIEGVDLKDNSLDGRKLVDNSVDGAKLADEAIESRHLKDNSIGAEKIKDNTIENVDIKDNTLDGSKIKDNTIEGTKIANGAITEEKLVDDSVTSDKIGTGAVTENKIENGAVGADKIGAGAVTTNKIEDEAVTEDKLAPGAVTTPKLADGLIQELQDITDAEPTENSVKPLQSGGAFNALKVAGVFDVSLYNAVDNTPAEYADLSAAIAAIPANRRAGGMSIKFIQSSDHKYVQYRYMSTSIANADFTDVNNWQGIISEVRADDNLVEGKGISDYVGLTATLFEVYKQIARNSEDIGGPIILKSNHRYKAKVTRSAQRTNGLYICSGTASSLGTVYMDLSLGATEGLEKEVIYVNNTDEDISANIAVTGNWSTGYWSDLHLIIEESNNNLLWTSPQTLNAEEKSQVWNNLGIESLNYPAAGSDAFVKSDGIYPAFGVLFNLEQQTTEEPTWYITNVSEGVGTISPSSQYRTSHFIRCYKGVKYELKIVGDSSIWQENDKVKIGISDHVITQTEQISVVLSEVPNKAENTYIVEPNIDGYMYIAHLVSCSIISLTTKSRLSSVENNVDTLNEEMVEVENQVTEAHDAIDIANLPKSDGYIDGNNKWQLLAYSSTVNRHSIIELEEVYDNVSIQASSLGARVAFLDQMPEYPIVADTDVVGLIGNVISINSNTLREIAIPSGAKYIYVLRDLYGNNYTPSSFILNRASVSEKILAITGELLDINGEIVSLDERTTELELYHKEIPFENILRKQYLDTRANGEIYERGRSFYANYFLSEEGKTYKLVNNCIDNLQTDAVTIGYCENEPASGVVMNIVSRYIPKQGDNITLLKGNGKYICCTFWIAPNTLSVYTVPNKEITFEHMTTPSTLYAIKYNANGFNLLNRLYVEGIVNNNNDRDITISGAPSIFAEEESPTTIGNKTIKAIVSMPDSYPYNMNIKIQRVNPALLQNKNIRIAHIGDSLTDQGVSCVSDFIIKCLNQDYGNISAVFVGTKNDNKTIKLGNYEFACNTYNQGTGGWAISDYLRKLVHVNYGGTTGGSQDSMPGKVAWDSLGLATKTRNGVQGRETRVDFEASIETSYEIRNACHGWYDADPSAELWDWIVNKRGITSFTYNGTQYTFGSSYSSADDATQIAAIKYMCSEDWYAWNSNPFFDIDTVVSSNGQYAFNYAKYLSRYKTLADDGVTRLVVGDTAGTRVTNITSHDLCTPSHVCLVMSTNGGIEPADAEITVNDLILCGDLIKEVDNNIKVIIGSPRPYGFCNPQLYTNSGCFKNYTFSQRLFNCNEVLKQKIAASGHLMIDLYAIQNPGGTFKKTAFDLLDGNEKIRDVGDLTHAGELIGYIDRAYQFVGAIISTLN